MRVTPHFIRISLEEIQMRNDVDEIAQNFELVVDKVRNAEFLADPSLFIPTAAEAHPFTRNTREGVE